MSFVQCAVNGANGSGSAFFLRGDHFALFDWNRTTTAKDGSTFNGRAVGGPFPLSVQWSLPLSMTVTGFSSSLDAGLSGDAGGSPTYAHKLYFMRGAAYVRYDYNDPIVQLPDSSGSISTWNLPGTFTANVKGALNGKASRLGYAYFFQGQSYVRYKWSNNTVDTDYPRPISSLIDMPQLFWSGIDASIDGDGTVAGYGYLFRDDQYCRYNWTSLRVDNGPNRVWENWPGVLEYLLAAEARVVALAWVSDARNQLGFYIQQVETGIPSPFDTVLMETALQTHFHIATSMPAATRLLLLKQIKLQMENLEVKLQNLEQILVFHDDGEVKAANPAYVEADGSPGYRAYSPHGGNVYMTSRFFRMNDSAFPAAAVLIHELIHHLDIQADAEHDSPEWYLTGAARLKAKKTVGGVEVEVDVEYYDQLKPADAVHNPSSYNAFSQHVHFTNDRRIGAEKLRPGY